MFLYIAHWLVCFLVFFFIIVDLRSPYIPILCTIFTSCCFFDHAAFLCRLFFPTRKIDPDSGIRVRYTPTLGPEETLSRESSPHFIQQPDIANYKWELVIKNRRSWTSLSIMVLAISGLGFIFRTPLWSTPMVWSLSVIGLLHGLYWLHAQHAIRVINNKISEIYACEFSSQKSFPISPPQPVFAGPVVLRLQERVPQAGQ